MKRIKDTGYFLFLLVGIIVSISGCTPKKQAKDFLMETDAEKEQRMQWWKDATFGMFIHWGVYSVPAGVYHGVPRKVAGEWIMNDLHISVEEYETFPPQFNPVKFNAKEWVRIAREGGAKYIIITTKHHDGFCLWDSKVSRYDIMDATPFKRDILKELSDECRKQGIHFGTYYSIVDWHHPKATPRSAGTDYNRYNYEKKDTIGKDWADYRDHYMKPQLKEIVKKYRTEVLWFDGDWSLNWTEEQARDMYNYLRNLNENLIINNRLGKGRNDMQGMSKYKGAVGDFCTPQQEMPEAKTTETWETCMTMNDTWGYKTNDTNWKSAGQLIHYLIYIAAKGGNYLLNVGPTSEGLIPEASVERFAEMGKWLKINGEAIYGTSHKREVYHEEDVYFTTKGNCLYLIATRLEGKELFVKSVQPVENSEIQLLGSSEKIAWKKNSSGEGIIITVPKELPCDYAWVFKIENN